ncbi:MAG: sensor histidine kinase [Lachnospiraceae bacterium]|nr:sensor histidine kinase [Lachnospiraceae bacterium]
MKKRGRRPIKLRQKILAANMLFFALPCLITFLCILTLTRADGNRRINQNRMAILQQMDSSMGRYLDSIAMCIQYVWEDYGMNQMFARQAFQDRKEQITANMTIVDFLTENSRIDIDDKCDLMVLTVSGSNYSTRENINSSTHVYPQLEALEEEEWFHEVTGESRIHYIPTKDSEEYMTLNKDSAFHVVCGIRDFSGGDFVGIVDVNIPHEELREIFSVAIIQENQKVALMDHHGNIISSTNSKWEDKTVFTEECLEQILTQNQGYYSAGSREAISQVHFVTNQNTGWKIVLYEENPLGEFLYLRDSMWIIFAIGLCVFLVFIMSIYDAEYISKPVKKLKEDMYNVYRGDFSVRMEVEDMDEFGELNLQFNLMVERVEQLIAELKKKDEEARILELQALQAQINPHFLYNTLASIRFLLEVGMEDKAGESLMALGKLLRRTFSDYRNLILVREELQALENYLTLMNNRYQNTFQWSVEVEEEVLDYLIPRISIQPLVENSISHGFNDFYPGDGKGLILIRGRKEGDRIILSVEDNGQGANPERIEELLRLPETGKRNEQVSGIGMKNVHDRIQLFFGSEYGLHVKGVPSGGICVILCLPAQKEESVERAKLC